MQIDVAELLGRVLACPLVAGVHAGPLGQIVTATDTGPIVGVLLHPAMIVIGVVSATRADPGRLAAQVRAAVTRCAPGVPVSVSILPAHRRPR